MFSDQTIAELIKGNPEAFKTLFFALNPRLKGFCKLFIADENLVKDIVQESFLALWEKHESIKVDKSVESLLFVMVRNRCLNELRRQKLEGGQIGTEDLKVNDLQFVYQLDFTEKEDKSIEEMLIESFQKAVQELPDKMKTVFVQCKIEGKNQKEVAEHLGISIKMVEKHIAKAKEHIRGKLLKQYPSLIILVSFLFE